MGVGWMWMAGGLVVVVAGEIGRFWFDRMGLLLGEEGVIGLGGVGLGGWLIGFCVVLGRRRRGSRMGLSCSGDGSSKACRDIV